MNDRLEFKFAADGMDAKTGEFAGYGSIFGNLDTHGDVMSPGAFSETLAQWKSRGSLPSMKLMHGTAVKMFTGTDLPIGKWREMREDDRGLYVEGKLSGLDTDQGRFNFSLMKDGALNALSIGYKAIRFTRNPLPGVTRSLQAVQLIEVSLVPQGSNDESLITDIKSWAEGKQPTAREFEEFLRDAAGFSKAKAVAIATKAAPHLRGDPDGEADSSAAFAAKLIGALQG